MTLLCRGISVAVLLDIDLHDLIVEILEVFPQLGTIMTYPSLLDDWPYLLPDSEHVGGHQIVHQLRVEEIPVNENPYALKE